MLGAALAPTTASAAADTASASPRAEAPAAGFWSCTVPPGHTFTGTQSSLACSPSGVRTMYYVQLPADGMWACTTMPGFTFTGAQNTLACSPSGVRTMYYLRAL
ncbi:hypothetical protein V1460_18270 [Streptomyces sp. SCSIO 30461]|uniref:hypothetical protein n=1 Tax=Streptomyces sp. SCSIO 30461 TaxID=3118085 RepID=UPI0030CB6E6B